MNYWMPEIEIENAYGTRQVGLATRHLTNRKIFLTGAIDMDMANMFIAQLLFLEEESSDPVTVYINSPGGEVNSGLLIYDAIQGSKLKINIVCIGMCASMAAIILAGGKKGCRYILPHSKVMIHEPLIPNGVGGSASSIRNISDSIIETRDLINGILSKHTGKTVEEINDDTRYDNYMNAEEAVKYGLCDHIISALTVD